MFRISKSSSSGRLVRAVLWYFLHVLDAAHPDSDQTAYMDA
jgi:hypothetical protein